MTAQDKELRRLRQYILQIKRCQNSKARKVVAAWNLDEVFQEYMTDVVNLIEGAQDSVGKLMSCVDDDYSKIDAFARMRLLGLARQIRELDEETPQDLFVTVNKTKKELYKLRKAIRNGKASKKEIARWERIFNQLPKRVADIMADYFISGAMMREIAKRNNVSISRIGDVIQKIAGTIEKARRAVE